MSLACVNLSSRIGTTYIDVSSSHLDYPVSFILELSTRLY
jgi:hypothetical protein